MSLAEWIGENGTTVKKLKKYFEIILYLAAFVVLTAGCGRGEEAGDSGAGVEGRKDYVSEYVDLGGGISDMAFYYGMQQFGDELCYLSDVQDNDQVLEKYSLTEGSRNSVSFTWLEPGKRYYIARFTFAGDGGIYAIVYQYSGLESQADSKSESAGSPSFVKQLCGFDAQGNQFFAVDLSEQLSEESGNVASRMLETDAQGHIYIAGRTKIWLYELREGAEPDYWGEVSVCTGQESRIRSVVCGKDGMVYACYSKGEEASSACSLARIDFDQCGVSRVYEDFPGAGGIVSGAERDFLVRDDRAVYEYDLVSGDRKPVLYWMEHNVADSEVQYFGMLTDGRIYVVTRDWEKEDAGILIFSETEGGE